MKIILIFLVFGLSGCVEYNCARWQRDVNAAERCIAEPSCMTDVDDLYDIEKHKRWIYRHNCNAR